MRSSNSSDNSTKSSRNSALVGISTHSRRSGRAFSLKRIVVLLGCVSSLAWFLFYHATLSGAGFRYSFEGDVRITIVWVLSMVPMLYLRGRWLYVVGVPYIILALCTTWGIWT